MENQGLALTEENERLNRDLELEKSRFLELFMRHKYMVEQGVVILTSQYLQKLGHLQLELLQRQTEAARLKMKMNLIQAAINRNQKPDLVKIEESLTRRLIEYYAQIEEKAQELDRARQVLSHLIPPEEARKLRELFRVLCKRLHPDLNPGQSPAERELFLKVQEAYELNQLAELERILLFLDAEKPVADSNNGKLDRIESMKKNSAALKEKIEQLKGRFPFTIEALIRDDAYIAREQQSLREQIRQAEEEIEKYETIIKFLSDA